MRRANVYFRDWKAGVLEETDKGFRFTYDDEYLKNSPTQAISLTFPPKKEPYESPAFFPFFEGMVPEGWYLDIVSRTLKVDPDDRFGLLIASASHTIGAVTVRPMEDRGANVL